MADQSYVGEELPVFANAANWKAYIRHLLGPWLRGSVLEVGAGIGATTEALWSPSVDRWTCLEPDASLADECRLRLDGALGVGTVDVVKGSLRDVPEDARFDALLYIDVLEHIERDADEVKLAAAHLAPGGVLLILSPAHQWLYSEFDHAIGHHRRYTKRTLSAIIPTTLRRQKLFYADSLGAMLSFGNRLLLRQSSPGRRQIHFWDRIVVPASRILDGFLGHSMGRSIIGVYRRRDPAAKDDADSVFIS